jgi:hypothetical protein
MIKTFIYEIDKQIAFNRELYNQTKFEIFKQRIKNLEIKKKEIIKSLCNHNHHSF